MISEPILTMLLNLSGHLLSGHLTTLIYKFHPQVEKFQREGSMLDISHQLEMKLRFKVHFW